MWFQPQTSILDFGYADLSVLFQYLPLILLIFIPSALMHFLVEDVNSGTIDFLFSKPISDLQYWAGYFIGAFLIVFLILVLSLFTIVTLEKLALVDAELDYLQFAASYIGVTLLALVFIALSIFAATIANNTSGAFLLGVILCYIFYAIPGLMSEMPAFSNGLDYDIEYFGLSHHLDIMSRGILPLRSIIYFLSLTFFFSYFSVRNLKKRIGS